MRISPLGADGPRRVPAVGLAVSQTHGKVVTISLEGELDIASADQLPRLDGSDPVGAVVLDLSLLSFMDSAGLRAVLALDRRCREHGGELFVVPGPPVVQRIFELTGVTRVLRLVTGPD